MEYVLHLAYFDSSQENENCDTFLRYFRELEITLRECLEELDGLMALARAVREEPEVRTPQSQGRIEGAYQRALDIQHRVSEQRQERWHQQNFEDARLRIQQYLEQEIGNYDGNPERENTNPTRLQLAVRACFELRDAFIPAMEYALHGAYRGFGATDDPARDHFQREQRCDEFLEPFSRIRSNFQGQLRVIDALTNLAQVLEAEPPEILS
ncbi:MAG: hypothetical protein LBF21_00890 [Puniceicoccales bacterium]|jgi:hypothetical protein|nr:hypothetical protein [Puniceicoccales bacterium]